ncbi:amidase [uncultured Cohaesibacter sp.]|uniref:amidase n=1 Tax=uncultured Cohaesibacter sp. TaxID=1002546 RepID=UPI0029C8F705|nr:amidase [uncultured Cohaesibacter sp.]
MTKTCKTPDRVAPISLLETRKRINAGELSPRDAVSQCLDRIQQFDGDIHAFTSLNGHALDQVPELNTPLGGIAFAVKDVFETADLPTEYNSPIYRGHEAKRDATIVAQGRDAGATLIGKSVTTEFAFFHPGNTRNPYNLDHTPGGSSSGSAAAVAAGMAHLGIGTQTGGSTIRPAAYCGVTGYKPSTGLLPKVGLKDFSWTLDTVGLFTATVADVAYAASALTGRNLAINVDENIANPRIGIARSHSWQDADPEYRHKFDDLMASLKSWGAELVEIEPSDDYIAAFHAHQIIQDYEGRQSLAWEYTNHSELLSPLLQQTLDFALTITPSDYDEAKISAGIANAEIEDHFEDLDIILSLSAPGPAPRGLESTGSSIFNRVWTLFGLPCLNVPGLMNDNGLPLGVQVIGPHRADRDTLQHAHWLEGAIKRHLSQ